MNSAFLNVCATSFWKFLLFILTVFNMLIVLI